MADRTAPDIYKERLGKIRIKRDAAPDHVSGFVQLVLGCDPQALGKAAKFYRLKHTRAPDLAILAHILAQKPFGKSRRGPKKGNNKSWDDRRFLALGIKYYDVKSQNPNLNDTGIADLISRDKEFKEYRDDPTPIRQKLPRARKAYQDWERYARYAGPDYD